MSLSTDLAKIAARNKAKLLKVAQNSLMRIGGRIVVMSPVRDGIFKNNWMSAYGGIDSNTTDSMDATGSQSIGRLDAKLNGLAAGQMFYFTNSLPYAEKLEYGYSQQAPAGMVRLSVANWQTIVADEVRKAK